VKASVLFPVISVVERYFRLGLKYLIPLKESLFTAYNYVLIVYIAYSSIYIHEFTLHIYN